MITIEAVQQSIYDWIKEYRPDGVKVIWDKPGEPRPPKPYISLNLITPIVKRGQDELRRNPQHRDQLMVSGVRQVTLSLNAFGEGAFSILSAYLVGVEMPSVQAFCRDRGFVVVECKEVRDLSTLLDTKYETRAQMDVILRLSENVVDPDTGSIETIGIHNGLDVSGSPDRVISADGVADLVDEP